MNTSTNPLIREIASKLNHPLAWTYAIVWSVFNWRVWPYWFADISATAKVRAIEELPIRVWCPFWLSIGSVLIGAPILGAVLRFINDWFHQLTVPSEAAVGKARREHIIGGLDQEIEGKTAELEEIRKSIEPLRAERDTLEGTRTAARQLQIEADTEKERIAMALERARSVGHSELFQIVHDRTHLDVAHLRDADQNLRNLRVQFANMQEEGATQEAVIRKLQATIDEQGKTIAELEKRARTFPSME